MWTRRYIITALLTVMALQTSLQAQDCSPKRGWGALHLLWPYTAEYRERNEYTDNEGRPSPAQQSVRVVAQDSQGRHLDRWTNSSGNSSSYVSDPVAAETIVWNTSTAKAKILRSPTPVADRSSCWQGPDSERHFVRNEPQIGWTKFSCAPAGQHQPQCRDVCEAERLTNAVPPEKEGFPKCDPAEPGGTAEDLGMDVIQGVAAHGCRTTTPFPKGKRKLREIWSDEYGLSLRKIEEDPTDAKYFQELISLSRNEPDPSIFQPPKKYEVVTLEMEEAPCEAPVPHSH